MIKTHKFLTILRSGLVILITAGFISACNESKPKKNIGMQKPAQQFKQATTLKGLVSNDKSPIKTGELKVFSDKNKLITSTQLQDNGHYEIEIPAKTFLPLILKVVFKSTDSKTETLISAVVYNSMTKFDVNPLTTKIAKKAKELGGYTHSNMMLATESMVTVPDENKTTSGFRGDPTKQYGGWH